MVEVVVDGVTYVRRYPTGQIFGDPSGSKAIVKLKSGVAPEKAGRAGANENGNGSLMRIAPLVFYLSDKPETERFSIAKAVSSITRAHEWPAAARFICLEYLRMLVGGMDKTAAHSELRKDFRDRSPRISGDTLSKFTRILRADTRILPEAGIKSGGFVIDTLEAALWSFLATDTCRDAVLKAAGFGDDTDTTAAVTGAMAGLCYGLGAVPADWLETLAARTDICRIAKNLAAGLAA